MNRLIVLISILFISYNGISQSPSPIIFIYDASGSMWGQIDGVTKMEIASTVLSGTLDQLPEEQSVGLVVYGHRQKGDCRDVEFRIDMHSKDKTALNASLKEVKPLGRTPLAYSSTLVIDKLRKSKSQATIILITDGIESCDGNICDVITAAKNECIEFKLHIVGFGLKEGEAEQLICAAQAGNGNYYDALDAAELSKVLIEATSVTVDEPESNISVFAEKNNQAIDATVKAFPKGSTTYKHSVRTYQDTGFMYLPPGVYDLEVTPLENSDVNSIVVPDVEVKEGHVIVRSVSFDGGIIKAIATNNGEGWDTGVAIVLAATGKRVASGRTYGKPKDFELSPGIYHVKYSPQKIKGLELESQIRDIEVKAKESVTVNHDFASGIAKIGAIAAGNRIDVSIQVYDMALDKYAFGGRTYTSEASNPKEFIMKPGTYKVILKGTRDLSGVEKTFTFEIKAGESFERITEF